MRPSCSSAASTRTWRFPSSRILPNALPRSRRRMPRPRSAPVVSRRICFHRAVRWSASSRARHDDVVRLLLLRGAGRRPARGSSPVIGETDGTHDPSLQSWVATANAEEADFPIQNLPFGVFRRRDARESARIGVAIGDRVLDLGACAKAGLLEGVPASLGRFMGDDSLNRLMGEGREAARMLRRAATAILQMGNVSAQRRADAIAIALTDVELLLPVHVGDYSDFYASVDHATNVGSMFRPDNPLLPNYRYVPIGYHGRASSLVMSGTAVKRPRGQTRDDAQAPPTFGPN